MRRFCLAALLCVCAGVSAFADTFHLTFTDSLSGGDVFLTGDLISPGQYLIASATGSIDGSAIDHLFLPGGYPTIAPNDNYLFFPLVSSYVDVNGLSFSLVGGESYNLYYSGAYLSASGIGDDVSANDVLSDVLVTPAPPVAPTPEPSSLVLLGTGVAGMVAAMRRRSA